MNIDTFEALESSMLAAEKRTVKYKQQIKELETDKEVLVELVKTMLQVFRAIKHNGERVIPREEKLREIEGLLKRM